MTNDSSFNLMDKIISLCKRRGFIFPGSEIYGGLANSWDFGPLGVELKNNIKKLWWKNIVFQREEIVGLDSSILMNSKVWEASGHLQNFYDPLVECKQCHNRFRLDSLPVSQEDPEKKQDRLSCPLCGGELTSEKKFNLMFKTFLGATEESANAVFLRPETAQGIFINFKNILTAMRGKLPLGIAQIGKVFRNEITPGNFIFRTREFEQMELEYFVNPQEADSWFNYWQTERLTWYDSLGLKRDRLREREHNLEELAHYAKKCVDIEYQFPFGWSELEGIANRGDFDLKNHSQFSGQDLSYFDEKSGEKYFPYVIEPSVGVERAFLAILLDAYAEEHDENGDLRVVLKLNSKLAPIKVAVFPLVRNNEKIVKKSREVFNLIKSSFTCDYDVTGSIGRRYRRQDEIGTPFCLTIDYQTLEDDSLTIRERDSMNQVRVKIPEIIGWLSQMFNS